MSLLSIVIDTREQLPWCFPPDMAVTGRGTLRQGDYALAGDDKFAIERKNLDDFVGTMASGWPRFERELGRMQDAGFVARVIIVEGSVSQIVEQQYTSPKILPAFLFKRIGQLTMMGVTVLFAGSVEAAIGLAYAVFRERHEQILTECNIGIGEVSGE